MEQYGQDQNMKKNVQLELWNLFIFRLIPQLKVYCANKQSRLLSVSPNIFCCNLNITFHQKVLLGSLSRDWHFWLLLNLIILEYTSWKTKTSFFFFLIFSHLFFIYLKIFFPKSVLVVHLQCKCINFKFCQHRKWLGCYIQ